MSHMACVCGIISQVNSCLDKSNKQPENVVTGLKCCATVKIYSGNWIPRCINVENNFHV